MATQGRPTDYTPDIIEKARAYLDGGWQEEGDAVPQIAGLALAMGIDRSTCYAWDKDPEKADFSNIFTRVQQLQERELVNNGLRGDFNPAITKMMMTKHGYSDKQEVDHTSKGESLTPIERVTFEVVGASATERD